MKNINERHLSVRINDELLKKFRFVCDYDGRSANSKIIVMIRNCVAEYEKEFGTIEINKL